MMLDNLKEEVWRANLALPRLGLVIFTWGNASAVDRARGLVVIKPSGVPYEELKPEQMVVLDLEGNAVEGKLNPSSDTPTHLALYRAFPAAGGIVHTHSPWATAWAQAGKAIPALGTTHADYFYGAVPCTRRLRREEIEGEYEAETGRVIAETFRGKDPSLVPAVLVASHGPFTWGKSAGEAVHHAAVLEETAKMAYHALAINPRAKGTGRALLDRHFWRKHGRGAYYGQGGKAAPASPGRKREG